MFKTDFFFSINDSDGVYDDEDVSWYKAMETSKNSIRSTVQPDLSLKNLSIFQVIVLVYSLY